MRRYLSPRYLSLLLLSFVLHIQAQPFADYFEENTLRLDYVFAGNADRQSIYLDQLCRMPRWYGKHRRLSEVPLRGNGSLIVRQHDTGATIYRHSFSTLFQEWLSTAEAKRTQKSFENTFLIPFPKSVVDITVELRDYHDRVSASLTHTVDPTDILIRQTGTTHATPYVTLQQAADTLNCIHIAFLAEGYTGLEMERYLADCQTALEALFQHEPFKSLRNRFNIIALLSPSLDSGVSEPSNHLWRETALGSHFDTFYSTRYLTTLRLKRMHDLLAGTPYEHIIILANTEHYGGGGIYNSYNLCYTRGSNFQPVIVHEFGHSFGGLADEYPYGDDDPMYFPDTEPWEPNLTTQHDFRGKWENLMNATDGAAMIEGGGYLTHGVWRAYPDCRMRTNEHPVFCPACQQALRKLIDFYTR